MFPSKISKILLSGLKFCENNLFGALTSSQKQKHRGVKMRGRIPAKWDSNGNFLKGLVWYEFGDEVGRTSLFFAEPCLPGSMSVLVHIPSARTAHRFQSYLSAEVL